MDYPRRHSGKTTHTHVIVYSLTVHAITRLRAAKFCKGVTAAGGPWEKRCAFCAHGSRGCLCMLNKSVAAVHSRAVGRRCLPLLSGHISNETFCPRNKRERNARPKWTKTSRIWDEPAADGRIKPYTSRSMTILPPCRRGPLRTSVSAIAVSLQAGKKKA